MSENNYQRTVLYQNKFFEVVSITWSEKSLSRMHNHGWSQCLILVEEGYFENVLDMGNKIEIQKLEVGEVIETPVGARHELKCLSVQGKTLHIYTPEIVEHGEDEIFIINGIEKNQLQESLELFYPTNLEMLKKNLDLIRKKSISTHSPYFMNQLFSGIAPQMLLAEELLNQSKTTMATLEASPAFSLVESEVIEALGRTIGWDQGHRDGVSVPGGSAANTMALHCARQKKFPQIKYEGMNNQKLTAFVSTEAHYSFKKACALLGLGTNHLILVPVDNSGKMRSDILLQLIDESIQRGEVPYFVSATAGTTVLGAFDNIGELAKICREYGLWLHVDGAWGGPAIFSTRLRPLVANIEEADSMTFDAHKLLGANLTCSFFLTKHKNLLLDANDVSGGDYLFHENDFELDRGKISLQCGRRADALSFWTIWKSLGNIGFDRFIDRLIDIREETLLWIQTQERLELISNPEFLNVCIRVYPWNETDDKRKWTKKVRNTLMEKNLAMVNYSSNEEGYFLRLILAHPYLELGHIKEILEFVLEVK